MEVKAKPGRKPVKKFNFLEVGEKVELFGKYKKYAHQYIYQFNKDRTDGKELKAYTVDSRTYVKRIA